MSNKFEYYFETVDGSCQEGYVTANNYENAVRKVKKENKKVKIKYIDVQPAY